MNNTNLLKTGFVNERFRYYEKLVAELTMMSDMFMRNVLNILECAEYVFLSAWPKGLSHPLQLLA